MLQNQKIYISRKRVLQIAEHTSHTKKHHFHLLAGCHFMTKQKKKEKMR